MQCDSCSKVTCETCQDKKPHSFCNACDKVRCQDCKDTCIIEPCANSCGDTICENCASIPDTCQSGCLFCYECFQMTKCASCEDQLCNCTRLTHCHWCKRFHCFKPDCKQVVRQCVVDWCLKKTCTDCRDNIEQCSKCKISVCVSHDGLVDCDECSMRHCKDCLTLCDKKSKEDCSGIDQKPAKRAKT